MSLLFSRYDAIITHANCYFTNIWYWVHYLCYNYYVWTELFEFFKYSWEKFFPIYRFTTKRLKMLPRQDAQFVTKNFLTIVEQGTPKFIWLLNVAYYIHEAKNDDLNFHEKQQNCSELRANAITERIINMLALDLKPIQNFRWWKELLCYPESGYNVPCSKIITKVVCKNTK